MCAAISRVMPDDLSSSQHLHKQRDTLLGAAFPTTEWSAVLRTQQEGAEAQRAMNDLCRRYWYPIYAYLRCRGFERADAQDLTQGFFLKVVTGGIFQAASQERGKLRSYLLGALNRNVSDHIRHESAEKRGGRAMVLPLECENAEEKFSNEPADHRDPESLYLASWARSLLDRVRDKVRQHFERTDRVDLFDALQSFIEMDEKQTPYAELAATMQTSEAALRLQVFRLRKRFAKVLREEVAQTVQTPEELEEELSWLSRVLRER